jgi:hypothetical protein
MRIAGVYNDACHSIPLANQIQRIDERWLTSHVYPGDTSHGQAFLHLDDLVAAMLQLVEERARLPRELPLLVGEAETLSYEELQQEFGRLIHGEPWETTEIPKALAKTGATSRERGHCLAGSHSDLCATPCRRWSLPSSLIPRTGTRRTS